MPPSRNTSLFLSAASMDPPVMSSFEDEVPASATGIERAPPAAAAAATGFGVLSGCSFHFRRQRSKIMSSRIRASTLPMTIPMIAAVDSFFLDLETAAGAGVGSEGDGAGEGKKGVQGGSGPPQRARFPAKAEPGN
ncbi:hypothetical protein MLD38_014380 [Melastoma candidum]|uniref:Uncharacterized protein n=1 Tax=Melastoma candidum TaxID=119954 RepID=A0ACB9RGA9_9MYRT|nr:hypothetical protein MLD38_014380 [Melastoma candidum]